MSQRKLIFFSTTGPDADDAAWRPVTLAARAVKNGLECETVLAGAATGLMRREVRARLEGRPLAAYEAITTAEVPVWLSPG